MTETKKERPQITGTIQNKNDNDYTEIAKVAIWRHDKSGNQPTLKGTITYPDGTKHQISLWEKTK